MEPGVLFVDDDLNLLRSLKRSLRSAEYRVLLATSGEEALTVLDQHEVDVVVTDQQMPGIRGTELLQAIQEQYPRIVRILFAGHATVGAAVHAINEGAVFRILLKPCQSPEVDKTVRLALAHKLLTDRSWSLLDHVRWQRRIIELLYAEHPELLSRLIARVDPVGAGDADDGGTLHLAMAHELQHLVRFHEKRLSPLV